MNKWKKFDYMLSNCYYAFFMKEFLTHFYKFSHLMQFIVHNNLENIFEKNFLALKMGKRN